MTNNIKRNVSVVLITVMTVIMVAFGNCLADPEATVDSTNPWESGGQITLTLSGCDGYNKITVVADFGGTVGI